MPETVNDHERMTGQSVPQSRTVKCRLYIAAMVLSLVSCVGMESGPASRGVTLEKTRWRLVAVEYVAVPTGAGRREAHISLDPEKKRVTGFGGVNGFFGSYDLSGEALRMPRLASTRRAGPPQLMELESAFLKALAATESYRITADELELLDSSGRVLARFQAQANP